MRGRWLGNGGRMSGDVSPVLGEPGGANFLPATQPSRRVVRRHKSIPSKTPQTHRPPGTWPGFDSGRSRRAQSFQFTAPRVAAGTCERISIHFCYSTTTRLANLVTTMTAQRVPSPRSDCPKTGTTTGPAIAARNPSTVGRDCIRAGQGARNPSNSPPQGSAQAPANASRSIAAVRRRLGWLVTT